MQTDHIVEIAVRHLFGRIIRRTLLACVIVACVIAAIYHFTVAGFLTLDVQFGNLQARLIVGAIYAAFALVGCAIWWAMRGKATTANAPARISGRSQQLVMLVEAVMLGFAMARKRERAN